MQENIKDKLHGIPIDVSVEIQDAKRKRRQSSLSQLPPVLDANAKNTLRSMVSARLQTRHGELNKPFSVISEKPKQKPWKDSSGILSLRCLSGKRAVAATTFVRAI